jgi:hypothetical protein
MALFAEFVIIVLGILVALGIEGLRDARRDRKLERQYAGRLRTDLSKDVARFEELELGGLAGKAEMLLALAEGGSVRDPREDPTGFMEYLEFSTWGGVAETQSAAFREMESTGRLGLLGDPQLRTALANYYEYHSFIASRYEDSFGSYRRVASEAFAGASQYSWLVEGSEPPAADLEAGLRRLRAHPEFEGAVNAELRYAASLLFWYRHLRSMANDLTCQLDQQYPGARRG